MEVDNKKILIEELNALKEEVSANVTRTVIMGYTASVGTLGLMIQNDNLNINQYFNYYSNFLNSSKLAEIVPIALLTIGAPLTICSVKGIISNKQKIKTISKEIKKYNS